MVAIVSGQARSGPATNPSTATGSVSSATPAGVQFRNPYKTRHTLASNLLMLVAVPLYVASQIGHADATIIFRTYGKWITAGLDNDRRERLPRLYAQTSQKRGKKFPDFN